MLPWSTWAEFGRRSSPGLDLLAGGTYTADAGTNQVILELQAPGGGSGGCGATGTGQVCISAPGSAGSYAKALVTSGFNGVTVTIGAAGTAGAAGANAAGSGGTTSLGSTLSCPGGVGGSGGAAGFIDGG
jgi:hypothetical protein